jgi:RNA-directed DNA polymerase
MTIFCRYADNGIVHCRTKPDAIALRKALEVRFGECKLGLHTEKIRIVYCKNSNRSEEYPSGHESRCIMASK